MDVKLDLSFNVGHFLQHVSTGVVSGGAVILPPGSSKDRTGSNLTAPNSALSIELSQKSVNGAEKVSFNFLLLYLYKKMSFFINL